VIIVNWNGGNVLEQCLLSVSQQTFHNFEVIVVDNASTDNSLDIVKVALPSAKILRMEENIGFAAANNAAVRAAAGQWLALLNSDAFPAPDWLDSLLNASEKLSAPLFLASCQIQANDPGKLDGTGDQYNIGGMAWRRQHNEAVIDAVAVMDEVFSACGAAAFYPRDAFLQAGGFDESFFSYLEDVDLGFRLRLLGYRCYYVPEARVLHVGSSSLGKESDFAIYHSLRNMTWAFYKNMPSPYFWKYLPLHILASLYYSFFYALCCCPWVSLRAARDALVGLPAILRARKQIQSNLKVHPQEVVRMIHKPARKRRTLIGLPVLPLKLMVSFITAVRKCRKQRQMPSQAPFLKDISSI